MPKCQNITGIGTIPPTDPVIPSSILSAAAHYAQYRVHVMQCSHQHASGPVPVPVCACAVECRQALSTAVASHRTCRAWRTHAESIWIATGEAGSYSVCPVPVHWRLFFRCLLQAMTLNVCMHKGLEDDSSFLIPSQPPPGLSSPVNFIALPLRLLLPLTSSTHSHSQSLIIQQSSSKYSPVPKVLYFPYCRVLSPLPPPIYPSIPPSFLSSPIQHPTERGAT